MAGTKQVFPKTLWCARIYSFLNHLSPALIDYQQPNYTFNELHLVEGIIACDFMLEREASWVELQKKTKRYGIPTSTITPPSYSIRAKLDFGFCSISVGIIIYQLATARLRAEVLRRGLGCHFRGPAVPRVAGELEAVGLPRKGLPRGDPLHKWFDTAQGGAEDSRCKLGVAPHSHPNIVTWRGGVSCLDA